MYGQIYMYIYRNIDIQNKDIKEIWEYKENKYMNI